MSTRWARDARAVAALVASGTAALLLVVAAVVAAVLVPVGVGLPVLDAVLAGSRRHAARRRRRMPEPVPQPYPPLPAGLLARLRVVLTDSATWRDLAWQAAAGVVLLPAAGATILLGLAALGGLLAPLLLALSPAGEVLSLNGQQVTDQAGAWLLAGQGIVGVAVALGLQRLLVAADTALARALLRPTARAVLTGRVAELTRTRTEAVDAQAVELRRIERDLHDGAQAQLIALTIDLGLAEQLLSGDARALVAGARATAGVALEGLRDIVRGIHPPVLAERGLAGGVAELAMAAAVPVDLHVDLPDRLAAPVESALYFTAAELLTNVGRHGGAHRVELRLRRAGDAVRLTVRDDGRGGAVARPGGGLDGLRRRLAAFDGSLVVDSPRGGPTLVEVTVPCGS